MCDYPKNSYMVFAEQEILGNQVYKTIFFPGFSRLANINLNYISVHFSTLSVMVGDMTLASIYVNLLSHVKLLFRQSFDVKRYGFLQSPIR